MSSSSAPDIDRILAAIRAEARTRGARERIGSYQDEAPAAVFAQSHGMPQLECVHVADFLSLPLDVFVEMAYRQVLGREPDVGGAAHYQRALLRGRLTRIEVLGRLRFSAEGRKRGGAIAGLAFAFALATAYRIPLAGPAAALVARALALPAHWLDRSTLEAAAVSTGQWMKR